MLNPRKKLSLGHRFRGFLPVVIDIETSGVNPNTDAILEIAMIIIKMNPQGKLVREITHHFHVEPFSGARIDPESIAINGIDVMSPLRFSIPEKQALHSLFSIITEQLAMTKCKRAVLVGHNAWFDLAFLHAATLRSGLESPFHSFTTLDTASICGVLLGETVLAKSVKTIGLEFDVKKAHSAIYDAEITADLFCHVVNRLG